MKADPITDHRQKFAETNIAPRLPKYLFRGSDTQQPRNADPMYGAEFIKPTRNESWVDMLPIWKTSGNDKFAPLEP